MGKRIQSTLEPKDFNRLERYAKKEHLSINTFVRWILLKWLDNKQQEEIKEQREKDDGAVYGP